MKDNFDHAFAELIENEGGFSNDPADPGGATMWGITERVARKHGYAGAMQDLPQPLAKQIARAEYWDAVRGDDLPAEVDFQVFDAAYNSGQPQAARWLQKAVGVAEDGDVGPATLAAVAAMDPDKVTMRFDAYRLLFLDSLKTWPSFGRGWCKRIAQNLIRATEP